MTSKIVHRWTAWVLALAIGAGPIGSAHAITVFDPNNYAQNIVQAARALEQIRNQIRQIEQSAAMLERNQLQLSPEVTRSIDEARALLEDAQGIAFQSRQLGEDLRTLYPDTWDNFELEAVLAQSDRWMAQSRDSLERAMAAEARASERMARTRSALDAALTSSAAAPGQTGAIQAGNQLLGLQAAQLAEIQALLIAQGRALVVERMEALARQERAREIQRRAFPQTSASPPAPARSAFGS